MADLQEIRAARQALGAMLASLRAAAGFTQHTLAPLVFHSRSTIANAETGQQCPPRDFWVRCDMLLGSGTDLVDGYDAVEALRQAQRQRQADVAGAKRVALVGSVVEGNGAQVAMVVADSGDDSVMSGSNGSGMGDTLRSGRWGCDEKSGLMEVIAMTAEESAAFVRRAGVTVNAELVEQLQADAQHWAVEYLRRPPYRVFRPIARLRTSVFDILDAHPADSYLTDLYLVAGQLTALLAHAAADLGQSGPAEAHARTAWLCADRAGHNQLRVYVRWVQANIAYWSGDFQRAVDLAEAGRAYATSGTGRLRLASQKARALASQGHRSEVDRALMEAAAAREATPSPSPREVGVWHFEPGKAAYYAAEARLALGGEANHRQAIRDAQDALALLGAEGTSASRELVAAAQQDLAAAHLAMNDLDGVAETLRPVLALPVECRTTPITTRMEHLSRGLTSAELATSVAANTLQEELALFCAYAATRALPAE